MVNATAKSRRDQKALIAEAYNILGSSIELVGKPTDLNQNGFIEQWVGRYTQESSGAFVEVILFEMTKKSHKVWYRKALDDNSDVAESKSITLNFLPAKPGAVVLKRNVGVPLRLMTIDTLIFDGDSVYKKRALE